MALAPVFSFLTGVGAGAASEGDRSGEECEPVGSRWIPITGAPGEPTAAETGTRKFAAEKGVRQAASGPCVAFTDEKARRLRRMTARTPTFRASMYHSAVAARLASEFSDRTDR
ncbi:unnamed protein product [Spirodela intermedia]|uniref:Uncharacterized protein n=1 Tax=Spirodela intermedia TaxID=51605 RepID=A0A7I8KH75_SPIIN|nr:unnamed protein product [Spirodela intermedia]